MAVPPGACFKVSHPLRRETSGGSGRSLHPCMNQQSQALLASVPTPPGGAGTSKIVPRFAIGLALAVAMVSLAWRTAYVIDCRRSTNQLLLCWERGPLAFDVDVDTILKLGAALGAGGGVGWLAGFNTLNPNHLRDPRRDPN